MDYDSEGFQKLNDIAAKVADEQNKRYQKEVAEKTARRKMIWGTIPKIIIILCGFVIFISIGLDIWLSNPIWDKIILTSLITMVFNYVLVLITPDSWTDPTAKYRKD